ncbi:MAG: hypothetical protein JST45_06645 [Bacteroidetes bacterium]|nr:hypothetical protein [Bacteroidota bacterium]
MSEGTLPISRFEAIEAYLLNKLSDTDRLRFEEDLRKDPALQAEVAMQRENMLAVELGGMQRSLRRIMAQGEERGSMGWGHFLKYAAAVAVLLTGALWWFSRPPLNERLYAEYHQVDPGLPVPMSATRNPAFQDAMVAYKLGNFGEAIAKWTSLLSISPANDTLNYYIASAQLAKGNAAEAIPLFKAVANDRASVFHAKARWFLFLSLLHEGRNEEMRTLGMEQDSTYGERVRQIEEKMNR